MPKSRPRKNNFKDIVILLLLSSIIFFMGNGVVSLTNPDEVFYAQTAKEMSHHNSWLTPYLFDQPQFEKPIFLYWLLRIAFIAGGVSAFSARFFPAVFGVIGIIAVYLLGLVGFENRKKSLFAGLVLMSSGLYIGLAKTVFTDMIFSVWILLSLVSFFWGYMNAQRKRTAVLLCCIFSALAILTKGPLGIIIPFTAIAVFLTMQKNVRYILCKDFFWGLCLMVLISFPWYFYEIARYGRGFIQEFFYNDHVRRLLEAEHKSNDTWYFYPAAMLSCMFPWSLYLGAGIYAFFARLRQHQSIMRCFMYSWIIVVFVIFQCAHSKLASYIFPLFPALALLAADFIYDRAEAGRKSNSLFFLSLGTFLLLLVVVGGLGFVSHKYPQYVSSLPMVYTLMGCIVLIAAVGIFLSMSRMFLPAAYMLVSFIPCCLIFFACFGTSAEPYVSSRDASRYLLQNYPVKGTILCSKFFVRGVRFYTDRETAVINYGDENFFSPHPVPFLHADDSVREFLYTQPVTYGIVKKTSVEDLQRIVIHDGTREFNVYTLAKIGDEYLVRVEPTFERVGSK